MFRGEIDRIEPSSADSGLLDPEPRTRIDGRRVPAHAVAACGGRLRQVSWCSSMNVRKIGFGILVAILFLLPYAQEPW